MDSICESLRRIRKVLEELTRLDYALFRLIIALTALAAALAFAMWHIRKLLE
jgi:hypothetical protein